MTLFSFVETLSDTVHENRAMPCNHTNRGYHQRACAPIYIYIYMYLYQFIHTHKTYIVALVHTKLSHIVVQIKIIIMIILFRLTQFWNWILRAMKKNKIKQQNEMPESNKIMGVCACLWKSVDSLKSYRMQYTPIHVLWFEIERHTHTHMLWKKQSIDNVHYYFFWFHLISTRQHII